MSRHLPSFRIVSIVLSLFLPALLFADSTRSWEKELAEDLVEIIDNKMVIETYELCKVGIWGLKFRTYSEAPANNFISRDNFVAITMASVLAYQAEIPDAECKAMKASDENIDLELLIFMTSNGMRQKFIDHTSDEEHLSDEPWASLL